MATSLNSIQAAKLEAEGKAAFSVSGRIVTLRTNEGLEHKWHCRTSKEAKDTLRLFRASLKYAN